MLLKPSGMGLFLIVLMVLGGAPAFAQTAAGAPTPQAKASPGVEEIVVTAQKREELSQQVPIALTVFSASQIQFRGIDQLSDLALQVHGMRYEMDQTAGSQIFIRGIGVDDNTDDLESPIATYVDGVYQTRTFRAPTLGVDLDRIEVLKGPQGTLFGRNATGGALNITLKPPSDDFTGTVKLGTGSYGQYLTEMSASGPLIKKILDLRISGAVSRDGGWIVNEVNGRTINDHLEGDGWVALSFHPLDNLSVDYELLLNKLVGGGAAPVSTNIQLLSPRLQLQDLWFVVPARDYINGNNPWENKDSFPTSANKENTQNSGTVKWDVAPWLSVENILAFQQHTIGHDSHTADGIAYPLGDFGNIPGTNDTGGGYDANDRFASEELNLVGSTKWINWVVGGYYGYENTSLAFPSGENFNNEITDHLFGRETLNTFSLFGDGTVPLPFHLSAFGGVRYTYDRKTQDQSIIIRLGTAGPYLHGPGECSALKFTDNFHNVSPRVGMAWALLESLNFYVKYSEGYNAGGHYTSSCDDSYKPETLGTIEGGLKGRWFDGRLTADFAGYYNKYKQFQFYQSHPPTAEMVNVPEMESWGGEVSVTALPIENVRIDLGLSLMHSQYDNFHDADPLNPAAGFQNLSGHQAVQAPNHTESVGLEYDWPIPWGRVLGESIRSFVDLGPLRLRGEWFHTDYIVFRPFDKTGFAGANDVQNPYSIFNFFATLPTEDGKWSLRFFAKN